LTSLKRQTIKGLFWSAIERFGYTFIMFVSNLFLARLLMPNDFGIIAMIMVFISISSTIVDSGFTSALIQKKEITNADCSTVLIINMAISMILCIVIYIFSPFVAEFYKAEELTLVLRTSSIVLLFNALSIIQIARFKKELNFKTLSIVSICSSIVGCILGVFMAYHGYGYWSLVFQTISIAIIKSILLYYCSKWKPTLVFSKKSFKDLFIFGSSILGSSLIDVVYTNTIPVVLGKFFSSNTLGNYTQARTLESVPSQTLITVIGQVCFPVFSKIQDDKITLKNAVRKSMNMFSYVNFAIMFLLIIVAEPLIILLYTEKWDAAIPLFQIACLGGMVNCVVQLNLMIISALGKGRLVFKSRLVRQSCGLALIFFGIFIDGLMGLMWVGIVLTSYLFCVISIYYTKKVFDYGFKEQLQDTLPNLLVCGFSGIASFLIFKGIILSNILLVMLKFFVFFIILFLLSKVFKLSSFENIIKEFKIVMKTKTGG